MTEQIIEPLEDTEFSRAADAIIAKRGAALVNAHFRRFVEILAAERTFDRPDLFDDCVQEGMIAAWMAQQRHPGHKDAYYRVAARHGVVSVLRGRPATGAQSRRGWQDAHKSSGPLERTSPEGVDYLVVEPLVQSAEDDAMMWETVRERLAA